MDTENVATTVVDVGNAAASSVVYDLEFKTPGRSLSALNQLLTYTVTTETLRARTEVEGPFADYADYTKRGLKDVEISVRVYKTSMHETSIVVPEDYALELDEVLRLKLAAEGDTPEAAEARTKLEKNELRNRMLVQQVVELLDSLADASYFKRVLVLNCRNWEDDWVRQTYSQTFVSSMAMTPQGDVLLFRAEDNKFLRGDFQHEWSHRLEALLPEFPKIFGDAIELEWRAYVPRDYALRSYAEHWAVIGEELLKPEAEKFKTCAEKAPIRTALFMMALDKCLEQTTIKGVNHKQLLSRVEYAREIVRPLALKSLEAIAAGDKEDHAKLAKNVQEFLNARAPKA